MAVYKHIYITDDQAEWLSKEAHRRRMRVSHLVRILIEQERNSGKASSSIKPPIAGLEKVGTTEVHPAYTFRP